MKEMAEHKNNKMKIYSPYSLWQKEKVKYKRFNCFFQRYRF